ncbi:MAG: DUF4321 domain-containing protein [Candidatus Eisenbacteria bacterium]|nr:DUF4321 domain-containing protein [Candidatus Eisenbacteria bacterium]
MSLRSRPVGILILVLVVGSIFGALVSQLIGLVLPQGVIRDFFVRGFQPQFGPLSVDLGVIGFTLGFTLKLTVASVLGIMLAVHIFRWY